MTRLVGVLMMFAVLIRSAQATVALPGDLGVLARDARSISRGRIVAVESRWTERRRGVEISAAV
jgi:hypothetical protein